jgi:hypothetical protein
MKILLSILLFCFSMSSLASIYEWKDSHGNVFFSDTPRKGARKLNIPEAQTYSPPTTSSTTTSVADETISTQNYDSLSITTPTDNSTIPNRSGDVNVSINISPALKKDDKIQLMMDGKPVGEAQNSTIFTMNNVSRGAHTLTANIVNREGETLLSSSTVTFYVQRPSTLLGPLHNRRIAPLPSAPAPRTHAP